MINNIEYSFKITFIVYVYKSDIEEREYTVSLYIYFRHSIHYSYKHLLFFLNHVFYIYNI